MSNRLLISLFEYKAWANRGLFDALLAAPAGEHQMDMMIIRGTLDHVSVVDQLFRARLIGEPEPFRGVLSPKMPSFGELRDTVAKTDAWYIEYVRAASPGELEDIVEFIFTDGDPGRMSREEMLGHVLTHGNSHRGAVGKMLENIKVRGAPDMLTSYLSKSRGG
jgi:uncharacterized damage-inducible protein DinB